MILRAQALQDPSLVGLKRLQTVAEYLVARFCRSTSAVQYDTQLSVSKRYPGYIVHCKVPAPHILDREESLCGAGHHLEANQARQLAALDVLKKIESPILNKHFLDRVNASPIVTHKNKQKLLTRIHETVTGATIQYYLEYLELQTQALSQQRFSAPISQQIPHASWDHVPIDSQSQSRLFFSEDLLCNHPGIVQVAKTLTLLSETSLPTVQSTREFIQINNHSIRLPEETSNPLAFGLLQLQPQYQSQHDSLFGQSDRPESFGMAKLFVELPKPYVAPLQALLERLETNPLRFHQARTHRQRRRSQNTYPHDHDTETLAHRRDVFKDFQRQLPLPVDKAPLPKSPVVMVQGDTGTGKTTRYPLMLSLQNDAPTKMVVAQPRRLACQAAAERVAVEQDTKLGHGPIGYAIRFDSKTGKGPNTVDFCTPGILLRRAMEDPTMSDVTHLVIDEVHERNADIDLLLSLARNAVKLRQHTDRPLQLVLMSATVETDTWSRFFQAEDLELETVMVPEGRRFPIDIVHLDSHDMPRGPKLRALSSLKSGNYPDTLDEQLCRATAELALHLFATDRSLRGSVLCFLPGMEEIRQTDEFLRRFQRGRSDFEVLYLHSSISSQEQRRVFDNGPKIILSTNIAETSLTIPDVKYVIDSGRERQNSLIDNASSATTVVGSELSTVDISKASAKQRAGRAGRVSAGTCYRLYSEAECEENFESHTVPEMLRMDLSQLVLHALSFNVEGEASHPLHLLLNSPDPPETLRLKQTLRALSHQGLINLDLDGEDTVVLTPLGRAVSAVPVPPIIGRMLFLGLALRAVRPALQIAAVLSVPKLSSIESLQSTKHCSDIVRMVDAYKDYLALDENEQSEHPDTKLFEQVSRIEWQLEKHMMQVVRRLSRRNRLGTDFSKWNDNGYRIASMGALVCSATPHIAHLVGGDGDFSTRDFAGDARLHPGSGNFSSTLYPWYIYNELRVTKRPYLHGTTAVSPLDLALFAEASDMSVVPALPDQSPAEESKKRNWMYIVDQWVPVEVSDPSQRQTLMKLRRVLDRMLQQVAQDPHAVESSPQYQEIIHYVLSSMEHQRTPSIDDQLEISQDDLDNYALEQIKTHVFDVDSAMALIEHEAVMERSKIGKTKRKSKKQKDGQKEKSRRKRATVAVAP